MTQALLPSVFGHQVQMDSMCNFTRKRVQSARRVIAAGQLEMNRAENNEYTFIGKWICSAIQKMASSKGH